MHTTSVGIFWLVRQSHIRAVQFGRGSHAIEIETSPHSYVILITISSMSPQVAQLHSTKYIHIYHIVLSRLRAFFDISIVVTYNRNWSEVQLSSSSFDSGSSSANTNFGGKKQKNIRNNSPACQNWKFALIHLNRRLRPFEEVSAFVYIDSRKKLIRIYDTQQVRIV